MSEGKRIAFTMSNSKPAQGNNAATAYKHATAGSAVKSADRVLDVFELFAKWGRSMSHSEIAEHLDIPKSSLSQLLHTLVLRGYLEFASDNRNYQLGKSFLMLVNQKQGTRDLKDLALPVLQELTQACGESSALNVLEGDEAVVSVTVLGPHRLVSHMREGDAAPLYATSGGKVLLAFLSPDQRDAYLARVQIRKVLPNSIGSVAALRAQLVQVRKEGVGYSMEEYTLGIVGLAVPVFVNTNAPAVAALNVAIPAARFDAKLKETSIAALKKAASRLTRGIKDGG